MVQCTVRETRPAQWAEAGCGGTSLQSLHFEDTGYKIKSSRLAWGQSISVVSLGYMRSWLETEKKAKQKVARGERQKTVKVMGSKALWVGRGLAEVKCSRKYEYRTLYEEARKRRGGLGQTDRKEAGKHWWDLCVERSISFEFSAFSRAPPYFTQHRVNSCWINPQSFEGKMQIL